MSNSKNCIKLMRTKGRDTTDVTSLYVPYRSHIEKHLDKKLSIHSAFLDLEKASGRVLHELIWLVLRSHDTSHAAEYTASLFFDFDYFIYRKKNSFFGKAFNMLLRMDQYLLQISSML